MDLETTRHGRLRRLRSCLLRGMSPLLGPLVLTVAGCSGIQSALDPAGSDAGRLFQLTVILATGGTVIFIGVTALVLYAIFTEPERRAWLGGQRTVVYGGLVFPVLTLSLLLPYGLTVLRDTDVRHPDALHIEVVGEQFWWRVRYPPEGDQPEVVTANELLVPAGRPVTVSVAAADVIHSFWVPNLAGKIDMIPGRINRLNFTAERTGVYRGVCTEFCGDQHARMAFDVAVLPPEEFTAWRAAQARPALEPSTPFLERGRALFLRGGCGSCHAIRGTEAQGQFGPDLTHVGSRRTIGAGQFPNNIGTLAGWIANTQEIKPGVRMPSYGSLSGEDLRALAGYLESLR